jgi:hypothetical protein
MSEHLSTRTAGGSLLNKSLPAQTDLSWETHGSAEWVTTTFTAPVPVRRICRVTQSLRSRYTKFEIAHPDLNLDPTSKWSSLRTNMFHIPPSTPSIPMRSLPRLRSSLCFTFSISMSRKGL